MINKESYLSEESQQSSAMSLELKQKVNDQFQRKKMEFYKMYNKNPKDYKEERGKRVGKSNKISYNIQGDLVDQSQLDGEGEDELPEVDQYSDYYEEEDEAGDASPARPGESNEERQARKAQEKERRKQANEEKARRK